MKLYFMRHGIANWPDWDRPDAERPLNKEGRRQTEAVAAALGVGEDDPAHPLGARRDVERRVSAADCPDPRVGYPTLTAKRS